MSTSKQWQAAFLLAMTVVLASALAVASVALRVGAEGVNATFTEFFVSNAHGSGLALPREAKVGQRVSVRITVRNHEDAAAAYRVVVETQRGQVFATGIERVPDDGSWPVVVDWRAGKAGAVLVTARLYAVGRARAYRTLRWWMRIESSRVRARG